MTITDMGARHQRVWGVTYLKCVKLALFGKAFPRQQSHSQMGAADGDRTMWLGAVLAMVVVTRRARRLQAGRHGHLERS